MIGVGRGVLPNSSSVEEEAGKRGHQVAVLKNTTAITSGAAVTTTREAPHLEGVRLGVSRRSLIGIRAAGTSMRWRIVLAVAHPQGEIYLMRKPPTISKEGTINGSMVGLSPSTSKSDI